MSTTEPKWHNPERVPESKIPKGWRLLVEEELDDRHGSVLNFWIDTGWTTCGQYRISTDKGLTYIIPDSYPIPGQEKKDESPLARQEGGEHLDTETLVCLDILNRQKAGIQKYGTTVAMNPLSRLEWLNHIYQEMTDAAVYLKRLIQEESK